MSTLTSKLRYVVSGVKVDKYNRIYSIKASTGSDYIVIKAKDIKNKSSIVKLNLRADLNDTVQKFIIDGRRDIVTVDGVYYYNINEDSELDVLEACLPDISVIKSESLYSLSDDFYAIHDTDKLLSTINSLIGTSYTFNTRLIPVKEYSLIGKIWVGKRGISDCDYYMLRCNEKNESKDILVPNCNIIKSMISELLIVSRHCIEYQIPWDIVKITVERINQQTIIKTYKNELYYSLWRSEPTNINSIKQLNRHINERNNNLIKNNRAVSAKDELLYKRDDIVNTVRANTVIGEISTLNKYVLLNKYTIGRTVLFCEIVDIDSNESVFVDAETIYDLAYERLLSNIYYVSTKVRNKFTRSLTCIPNKPVPIRINMLAADINIPTIIHANIGSNRIEQECRGICNNISDADLTDMLNPVSIIDSIDDDKLIDIIVAGFNSIDTETQNKILMSGLKHFNE